MVFASTVETLPHVQGGRARLLGVAGPRRLEALPDVPAIIEIVPGYVALNWYAIAAPRATPPAIIARMAETLGSIRDLPDVRTRFAAAGTTPLLTGPAELAALLETDVPQWQRAAITRLPIAISAGRNLVISTGPSIGSMPNWQKARRVKTWH